MSKEEIRRGEEAARLMAEPLLTEAFQAIEKTILAELKRVDVGAMNTQRDLVLTLQMLEKVRSYLKTVVETGTMAKIQEEQQAFRNKDFRVYRQEHR